MISEFQFMVTWPHYFGLVARQNIMARSMGQNKAAHLMVMRRQRVRVRAGPSLCSFNIHLTK
jgi:hypothetical protein